MHTKPHQQSLVINSESGAVSRHVPQQFVSGGEGRAAVEKNETLWKVRPSDDPQQMKEEFFCSNIFLMTGKTAINLPKRPAASRLAKLACCNLNK